MLLDVIYKRVHFFRRNVLLNRIDVMELVELRGYYTGLYKGSESTFYYLPVGK